MNKCLPILCAGILFVAACKKSSDSNSNSSTTFTANVNGKATTFNINSATLIRSTAAHEKRMDIQGISTDNSKRLIITLGLETDLGTGMTVKTYTLNPFPDDNPATPNIDESATTDGFSTYSTSLSNGNWLTNVYDEQGSFILSACDSTHSTVSGTFQTTLTDNTVSPAASITITGGKCSNVKYRMLN